MTIMTESGSVEFHYFGLWARVAGAVALEHSGLAWEYVRPADWKSLKPTTLWGCLPMLRKGAAAGMVGGEVGQEIAILDYIAHFGGPKMAGFSIAEVTVSKQLYGFSEDVYQALGRIKNGALTPEQVADFWSKERDTSGGHNRNFGIHVLLGKLESFYQKCQASLQIQGEGRFTQSGCTIGECKLFASIFPIVSQMELPILADYPGLDAFYRRFSQEEATVNVVSGKKTGGPLAAYFVKA